VARNHGDAKSSHSWLRRDTSRSRLGGGSRTDRPSDQRIRALDPV
jgi:hypothetical protein